MFKNRKGVSLIEIIISGLILLVAATAVSLLLLSTFTSRKREEALYGVSLGTKKLREELKIYVTGDTSLLLNAPGCPAWHLPVDTSCLDCWALQEGEHDATGLLPAGFREKYRATMKYKVKSELFHDREVRAVRINVDWSMP